MQNVGFEEFFTPFDKKWNEKTLDTFFIDICHVIRFSNVKPDENFTSGQINTFF